MVLQCNCDEVMGMYKVSLALMNRISNMRRQYENKAIGKLLGTILLTLSGNH
jgi:hypothetical protein